MIQTFDNLIALHVIGVDFEFVGFQRCLTRYLDVSFQLVVGGVEDLEHSLQQHLWRQKLTIVILEKLGSIDSSDTAEH